MMKKFFVVGMKALFCAALSVNAQAADSVDAGEAPAAAAVERADHTIHTEQVEYVDSSVSVNHTEQVEYDDPDPGADHTNQVEYTEQPARPGASSKPKIAVYVTGGKDVVENKALGTYILDALAATNRYIAIERGDAFLAEVDNEHIKQRSGAIDDSQISALGKQSGVQFVCVADITQGLIGSQVSARVINVETAEIVTLGVADGFLRTMTDLRRISVRVVDAMFRKLYPDDYARVPLPEKMLKFGVRAAYNVSYVPRMNIRLDRLDGDGRITARDYPAVAGFGSSGFEASLVAVVGITDAAAFSFSPGIIYRKPFVSGAAEISEMAVNIPVVFERKLFQSPVRALAGVSADIPFGTKIKWAGDDPEPFDERPDTDFGVILGVSVQITRNIAADAKATASLRDFDKREGSMMGQGSVGIAYLY